MKNMKLMLVADRDSLRTELHTFLGTLDGMFIVEEVNSGLDAFIRTKNTQPDVVVIDIINSKIDALTTVQLLNEQCPASRMLVLVDQEEKEYFYQLLAAGINGYLNRNASLTEIEMAIDRVAAGSFYLQPAHAGWVLEGYYRLSASLLAPSSLPAREPHHPEEAEILSRREKEVLKLVAHGLTSFQISAALKLSAKTIAHHRERIMKKLKVHSSTELVLYAVRNGVIQP